MVNRTIPPPTSLPAFPKYKLPRSFKLANGMELHVFNDNSQELVTTDFIFKTGGFDKDNPLLKYFTANLLRAGTPDMTAEQIDTRLALLGAFVQAEVLPGHIVVTVTCLVKTWADTWQLMHQLFTEACYPPEEVNRLRKRGLQQLEINRKKNSYLAREMFENGLYGNTAYGYMPQAGDFELPESSGLELSARRIFNSANCTVVIAGPVDNDVQLFAVKYFGALWGEQAEQRLPNAPENGIKHNKRIPVAGSLQTAIRIGLKLPDRNEAAYPYIRILCTILGGYFGSRLQKNLREEKGMTYGVGAGMQAFNGWSTLLIVTEVETGRREEALGEIWKEIKRLKEEAVPIEELELVKNFTIGAAIGDLGSIYDHANHFKNRLISGTANGFDLYFGQCLEHVTPAIILDTAREYFVDDKFLQITVG